MTGRECQIWLVFDCPVFRWLLYKVSFVLEGNLLKFILSKSPWPIFYSFTYLYIVLSLMLSCINQRKISTVSIWCVQLKKEVELKKAWISNGIWNLEARPFEIKTNSRHFVKHIFKSEKMFGFWKVWFLNGCDHSYSPILQKPDHLKCDLRKVWILNGQIFRSPLYTLNNCNKII